MRTPPVNASIGSFDAATLTAGYRSGAFTPIEVANTALARVVAAADNPIWISQVPDEALLGRAAALAGQDATDLPLYGLPFAVKDNIDVAGMATTAACPGFAYTPQTNAFAVQQLLDAGAMLIGKTNLDQFATGLVGTRSPYGAVHNAFDPDYISGGSSSGSAVAVALGQVTFALGTDTAGSGRIPAAFNNIFGYKPTRGLISNTGLVPACLSLDCISVLSLTAADAASVGAVVATYDPADAYARRFVPPSLPTPAEPLTIGVPRASQLDFFGDAEAAELFAGAIGRVARLGHKIVEIDFAPFAATAQLLYEGPWVAERTHAVAGFLAEQPGSVHPVTRGIIESGNRISAVDTFDGMYKLQALKREVISIWDTIGVLLTPTAGTIFRNDEVAAKPVARNSDLGIYTNYLNLLDMCACAAPSGFDSRALPHGVTFAAPAFFDHRLLALAGAFHAAGEIAPGAAHRPPLPEPPPIPSNHTADDEMLLAVCGAHMRGEPLNGQLRDLDATFVESARTTASYRFYALSGDGPPRPGLLRTTADDGHTIDLELWSIPSTAVGSLLKSVTPPLGLGTIGLDDGREVLGFIVEAAGTQNAKDITHHGSWRTYNGTMPSG